MSFRNIRPFYVGKWKPFRYSLIIGVIVSLLYIFAAISNGTITYNLTWVIAIFLGSLSLIVSYITLVITTLFSLWLNPPQKSSRFINDDWWKP